MKNRYLYFVIFMLITVKYNTIADWEKCNKDQLNSNITSVLVINNRLLVGTASRGIFFSNDNGNNWIKSSNGIRDTAITALSGYGKFIFAGTKSGKVYFSENEGETWSTGEVNIILSSIWVLASNSKYLYAGTRDSGLFISDDCGLSWKLLNKDLTYLRSLIVVDSLVIAGTFNKGLFFSSDWGNSWNERNNGLNDIDVRSLAFNGNDLFAGTSALGIFHSRDTGQTWKNEFIGSSIYASVWSIKIIENITVLGSVDRGIFVSSDSGLSWFDFNQGIVDSSVTIITFDSYYIYAVASNGLIRRKINEFGLNSLVPDTKIHYQIYPIPASDFLEINAAACEVRIFNVFGQEESTSVISDDTSAGGGQLKLDVSGLAPGVYFVRVGDKVMKFVKI